MFWAAAKNLIDTVELLIKKGAYIDAGAGIPLGWRNSTDILLDLDSDWLTPVRHKRFLSFLC